MVENKNCCPKCGCDQYLETFSFYQCYNCCTIGDYVITKVDFKKKQRKDKLININLKTKNYESTSGVCK
jgi:hypothetical protein